MATTLPVGKQVKASVKFVDKFGNAAAVDGVPVWGSSDPSVVEVVDVAPDGLSCTIRTVGVVGSAQVAVNGDADLGEGVRNVGALVDVSVVAAEAFSAAVEVGAVEDIPATE